MKVLRSAGRIGASCLWLAASITACGDEGSSPARDASAVRPATDAGGDAGAAHSDASQPVFDAGHDAHAGSETDMDAGSGSDAAQDASADAGPEALFVCDDMASYGAPLSAAALTATKVVDGLAGAEGPVWIASEGVLLFSEILAPTGAQNVQPSKIWRLTLPRALDLWLDDSGSNGLALLPDGKTLVAAAHDQQNVSLYRLADKLRTTLAPSYKGKAFHSPNDVAVRSDGTVYFTDPSYQQGNRTTNIVAKTAVYRVTPDKSVEVLDDTLSNPNGIALSPNEETLYVGDSGSVRKYAVNADGSTGMGTSFASGLNAPDGMTVDCAGNLYVAEYNTGLVHVYGSDMTPLGTIATSTNATNVAFGGEDHTTLFITAGNNSTGYGIYSIKLGVPGRPY